MQEENNAAVAGKQNETEKSENNKDEEKPSEPYKDYIHVRARRGQATDSHSIAERVLKHGKKNSNMTRKHINIAGFVTLKFGIRREEKRLVRE